VTGDDIPLHPAFAPDPRVAMAEFYARLRSVTPRVVVVPAIVALNALVFAVMVARGVSFVSPTADSVLRWGADYGPRTLDGEPWRLVTNVFVHFGIIHIGLNMLALWNAGGVIERLYGAPAFAALYLAAGLTGSLASLAVHPQTVSAGASGAVFGVYGALGAFLVRQRGVIPTPVLSNLQRVAVGFVAYNILFGFSSKSIDNAAHIGGLIGGAAAGLLLARPITVGRRNELGRPIAALLAAGLFAVAAVGALPHPLDFEGITTRYQSDEAAVLASYNKLVVAGRAGKMDRPTIAAAIENEILPAYRRARAPFETRQRWNRAQQRQIDLLRAYTSVRERGFVAIAAALRAGDDAAVKKASRETEDAAGKLLDQLGRAGAD
jgi:membrane associated rhomboid family serine protease